MPTGVHGLKRALVAILVGVVILAVLREKAPSISILDSSFIGVAKIIIMLSGIGTVIASPYWGTRYLLGWLAGFIILGSMGLVSAMDAFICVGIPGTVLVARFFG